MLEHPVEHRILDVGIFISSHKYFIRMEKKKNEHNTVKIQRENYKNCTTAPSNADYDDTKSF